MNDEVDIVEKDPAARFESLRVPRLEAALPEAEVDRLGDGANLDLRMARREHKVIAHALEAPEIDPTNPIAAQKVTAGLLVANGQLHSRPIGWRTLVRNALLAALAGILAWLALIFEQN